MQFAAHLLEGGYCQRLGFRQGERVAVALLQGALGPLAAGADGLALVTHEQPGWVTEEQLLPDRVPQLRRGRGGQKRGDGTMILAGKSATRVQRKKWVLEEQPWVPAEQPR